MIYRFRFFAVLLLTLLFASQVKAQEPDPDLANDFIEMAEEVMSSTKALTQALEMYKLAADADPNSVKANFLAGDTYLKTTEKAKSTQFLLRAYLLDSDYKFDMLYKIGRGYQYGYEFENAIEYYKKYKQKLENNTGYKG